MFKLPIGNQTGTLLRKMTSTIVYGAAVVCYYLTDLEQIWYGYRVVNGEKWWSRDL